MCWYWYMVLQLQCDILIFLRSIRECNFNVYITTIHRLIKWVFIFDHVHYACWLSVHPYDLADLENSLSDVHAKMTKGKFSFLKSNGQFSRMATNQQLIKGVGGGSDLLNGSGDLSLIRWEICDTKIGRIVSEFEEILEAESHRSATSTGPANHLEDIQNIRTSFINDFRKLHVKIICNPFELNELRMINNTSVVFSSDIVEQVKTFESKGENQLKMFEKERLIMAKIQIKTILKKNNFSILKNDLKTKHCSETLLTLTLNKLKYAASSTSYLKTNSEVLDIALLQIQKE